MKILHYGEVSPTDVDAKGAEQVSIRWLITQEDGAENFAMRFFEIDPGGKTPLHAHAHEHEVFIIKGEGVVWKEGNQISIKPGTAIFVPPEEKHCFINNGKEKLQFICLIPSL